jgi:hypothetical protein
MSQLTDILTTKRATFEADAAAFAAQQAAAAVQNTLDAVAAKKLLCRLITEGVQDTLDAGEQTSLGLLILRGNIDLVDQLGQAIELLLFYRDNPSEQHDKAKLDLLFMPASILQREGFVKSDGSFKLIHEP